MGLFSKKKPPEPPKPQPQAVVPQVPKPQVSTQAAAVFDADAYFKSQESKSVKGPKSIKESTIRQKVEEMELMLSQREEQPDYHAYDKNPVREKEMKTIDEKLDIICAEVALKEEHTRYKAIRSANENDVEKKVEELSEQYDYLTDEAYDINKNHAFVDVNNDEAFRSVQESDMEAAEKREKVKSTMPKLTDRQLEAIEEFAQSDIKAKPIDVPDDIPGLSTSMLDRMTKQFEEKYGSLKDAADKANEQKEKEDNALSDDEAKELERLKSIFG